MKAILIDDEELALKYLEYQLLTLGNVEVVGKYLNSLDAKKVVEKNQVDIIFLDIQMPELDGLELAEKLMEKNPSLNIVFVTAYDQYAVKAFELNALDYILKPVSLERLGNTVDRIKRRNEDLKKTYKSQTIRANLFGGFELIDDKNQKISLKWRTQNAEQVFLYLLHKRNKSVSKEIIIELLWPDIDYDKAMQYLYSSIYQIRKTIEPYKEHFQIKSIGEGYILKLDKVSLDFEKFEDGLASDITINNKNLPEYEELVEIAKGEYLEGYDYIWNSSERQRFEISWLKLSFKLLDYYYENKKKGKTMSLSLDIISKHPLEARAYLFLMKIFAQEGDLRKVKEYYRKLEEILDEELGEKMDQDIKNWYEKWENQ